MSGFRAFDGGEPFLRPEKPFLLLFEDRSSMRKFIEWFDDEEEFEERIREVKKDPFYMNIEAIEIGSCRDVNVEEI